MSQSLTMPHVSGSNVVQADLRGLLAVTFLGLAAMWLSAFLGGWICPLEWATGFHCPLCGGTRAAAAVMLGDISGAWALNPGVTFAAVSAPALVVGYPAAKGLGLSPDAALALYRQMRMGWLLTTGVLLTANWLFTLVS